MTLTFSRLLQSLLRKKHKEEFTIKNAIKFGLVGLAGYFVGFYEMKYKVTKFIAKNALERLGEKSPKEEGEKEES